MNKKFYIEPVKAERWSLTRLNNHIKFKLIRGKKYDK